MHVCPTAGLMQRGKYLQNVIITGVKQTFKHTTYWPRPPWGCEQIIRSTHEGFMMLSDEQACNGRMRNASRRSRPNKVLDITHMQHNAQICPNHTCRACSLWLGQLCFCHDVCELPVKLWVNLTGKTHMKNSSVSRVHNSNDILHGRYVHWP